MIKYILILWGLWLSCATSALAAEKGNNSETIFEQGLPSEETLNGMSNLSITPLAAPPGGDGPALGETTDEQAPIDDSGSFGIFFLLSGVYVVFLSFRKKHLVYQDK